MGVFKEEAYTFDIVARSQRAIFSDACDIGYPYNKDKEYPMVQDLMTSINTFKELDKKYPDEKKFIRSRTTWKNGVTIVIRIGWEIDEGMECGTEYTISYCFIGEMKKKPYLLDQNCNAFISVDSKPYREPK